MKVGVIMNPVAGGGGLRRHWPVIAIALKGAFGEFELRETQAARDAVTLAMDLAANGCGLVIAAGGDGTVSEVAGGLISAAAEGSKASLGVLPCGTGTDFARGLGVPLDPEAAVRRIAASKGRTIDAGRVSYVDAHGALASRHFINIASLGVSGAVASAVNADERRGRVSSKALFYWHTVAEFRPLPPPGRPGSPSMMPSRSDAPGALVGAANGKFVGGGMMVAPDAALDDSQFDIVVLRAASKLGLIRDIRLLYGGRHRNHPAITILRGRKVTVEPLAADGPLPVEADGESPGHIPATFEIVPGALTLMD